MHGFGRDLRDAIDAKDLKKLNIILADSAAKTYLLNGAHDLKGITEILGTHPLIYAIDRNWPKGVEQLCEAMQTAPIQSHASENVKGVPFLDRLPPVRWYVGASVDGDPQSPRSTQSSDREILRHEILARSNSEQINKILGQYTSKGDTVATTMRERREKQQTEAAAVRQKKQEECQKEKEEIIAEQKAEYGRLTTQFKETQSIFTNQEADAIFRVFNTYKFDEDSTPKKFFATLARNLPGPTLPNELAQKFLNYAAARTKPLVPDRYNASYNYDLEQLTTTKASDFLKPPAVRDVSLELYSRQGPIEYNDMVLNQLRLEINTKPTANIEERLLLPTKDGLMREYNKGYSEGLTAAINYAKKLLNPEAEEKKTAESQKQAQQAQSTANSSSSSSSSSSSYASMTAGMRTKEPVVDRKPSAATLGDYLTVNRKKDKKKKKPNKDGTKAKELAEFLTAYQKPDGDDQHSDKSEPDSDKSEPGTPRPGTPLG